jgi:hypothetical protein
VNQAPEAQVQQKLVQTPEAQHLLHWRALRRATMALGLVAALLVVTAYVSGDQRFAIDLMRGSLTLWLWVTIIKALTDRARPFNPLRETRMIGWREAGLSRRALPV